MDQNGDEFVYWSPSGPNIGISSESFSPLPSSQEPVLNMLLSNGTAPIDVDSRNDGTDMSGRDFEFDHTNSMFATNNSADNFPYQATPTTSDETFQGHLILTPQSTSRTYSRPTSNACLDPRGPNFPLDSCYSSPALYHGSVDIDLQGPVLRSQNILFDLGTPVPRVLPNPYTQGPIETSNDFDYGPYLKDNVHEPEPSKTAGSKRSASEMGGPWNSVAAHNSPYKGPGFSTYLPSYGPMAEYDNQHESPSCRPVKRLQSVTRDKRGPRPAQREKEQSQDLEWEHHFVGPADGSFRTSKEGIQHGKINKAKRKGPMSFEEAQEAAEVRKIHACWSCWSKKVKCDPDGKACGRCIKIAQSIGLTCRVGCYRQELIEFRDLFFPSEMVAHLKTKEIQNLVDEHISTFTENTFLVEVASSCNFEPIKLVVSSFIPRGDELTTHHQIRIQSEGGIKKSQLFRNGGAPVGMEPGIDMEDLRNKCNAHILSMVENSLYAGATTAGQTTEIPQRLLEIMQQYCRQTPEQKNGLIHKALMLHAMNHFMSRIISFTPKSTRQILQSFGMQDSSEFEFFSSRLLNRQIKIAMHHLHKSLSSEVLKGLHDEMKSKTTASWIVSFCTMIILCLCTEEQQVAVDGFTTFTMNLPTTSKKVLEYGIESCLRLDEMIQVFTDIFHEVYQTHERKKKFNPFLNRPGVCARLGNAAVAMVMKVKKVIEQNREEMEELREPVFDKENFSPGEIDLAMRNPGRLLSEFLLTFVD